MLTDTISDEVLNRSLRSDKQPNNNLLLHSKSGIESLLIENFANKKLDDLKRMRTSIDPALFSAQSLQRLDFDKFNLNKKAIGQIIPHKALGDLISENLKRNRENEENVENVENPEIKGDHPSNDQKEKEDQ